MPAISWFENNYMKYNKYTDYCHLIVSSCKYEEALTKIENDLVWESNDVKFFGITTHKDCVARPT